MKNPETKSIMMQQECNINDHFKKRKKKLKEPMCNTDQI